MFFYESRKKFVCLRIMNIPAGTNTKVGGEAKPHSSNAG